MTDFVEEIDRFLASFSAEEAAVSRYAFRALLNGRPAKVAELPEAIGLPRAVAEAAVAQLVERGTVIEDNARRIIGVRGLSLTETAHRLTLNGSRFYAFCAVDAVGIPAALEAEARIESRCHHCQAPLSLELRGGQVIDAPEGIVIWAVERDLSRSLRAHT